MIMGVMALGSAGWLVLRWRSSRYWLAGLCLIAAAVAGFSARRMDDYVFWFGMPIVAAAMTAFAERRLRGLMVPTVASVLLASPLVVAMSVNAVTDLLSPEPHSTPASLNKPSCSRTADYKALAAMEPGLVLSEIDLGPYIIANTPQ